jgi:hypothetical protein
MKGVGSFERHVHPALYDAILRVAHEKHVAPSHIHHVMTAEEAFPFIAHGVAVWHSLRNQARCESVVEQ